MGTDFDAYRILGVDPSASSEDIEAAYQQLLASQPTTPEETARRREAVVAYNILSKPAERAAYDERRQFAGTALAADETRPPERRNPWNAVDVAKGIGMIIGIVLLASIPVALIAAEIAGGEDKVEEDAGAYALLLGLSLLFQVVSVGVAWWFSVRKYGLTWSSLGLKKPDRGGLWLPLVLVVGSFFLVGIYGIVLAALDVEPDADLPDVVYDNALPLAIVLVLSVLVAPFVEEVVFRGFVFKGLAKNWGTVFGALGSAMLFGLAHIGNPGYFYLIPPIMGIGLIFVWGFRYSGSLFPSIIAHFIFNGLQMALSLATR